MAEVFSFEPKGLPGWRVFKDPANWLGSPECCWWYQRPADVPHTFMWDEAAQDHVIPEFNDWAGGPRKSAKGAVAAAHQHKEWACEKMARIAAAKEV